MIISASYKTDIPAFYGEWFSNRLNAGYCKVVNPFNRKVGHLDLTRNSVSGFVFWTKNLTPFLRTLSEVDAKGFPFVVQHTINGYPRELEYAVVDADRSVTNLRRVSEEYARVPVWRYDTIVISSLTPIEFHLRNFERLARKLQGVVDEVVISFAHMYRKTLRNMNAAAEASNFTWHDPSVEEKRDLASRLVTIATTYSMQLSVCSQPEYMVSGAANARCVDARRLEDIAAKPLLVPVKGNRKECGCFESRDIGEYDTCPHGCVYCYAVQDRALAQWRFKNHDPLSPFLFAPDHVSDSAEPPARTVQLPLLFDG